MLRTQQTDATVFDVQAVGDGKSMFLTFVILPTPLYRTSFDLGWFGTIKALDHPVGLPKWADEIAGRVGNTRTTSVVDTDIICIRIEPC